MTERRPPRPGGSTGTSGSDVDASVGPGADGRDGPKVALGHTPTAGTSLESRVGDPTQDEVFEVDEWCVRESTLRLDALARSESVFALSNGHVGLRGNLEEGEPNGIPGTYLNSVYERRPLPYAEAGYGYPESGQTVIDVTNGKIIRLFVDDEPFDVRYGALRRHERVLDLRAGTLSRHVRWTSPAERTVEVNTTRLVSLTHRAIVAMSYEVVAQDSPVRIVLQSELVANEELPSSHGDPRVSTLIQSPLEALEQDKEDLRVVLLHRTRHSGIGVAAAADHLVQASNGVAVKLSNRVRPDWGRISVTALLRPGDHLRILKFVGYGWSRIRSRPALRDQVAAGLTGAMFAGFDGLLADQRAFLDDFWRGADVRVDGDPELQQAVRFALFHLVQASARAEERPVTAKGLTGPGYDGHCFWDTEAFVLPVLIHTWPRAAADALRWRKSTLPAARDRARQLGLEGAAFPWRTINGEECSGYWPAGTAAFHINADVADAVIRYHDAVRDEDFDVEVGLELLVETARLWRSLGHFDRFGAFRLSGVTGPDEYSAVADDNTYTNLMAQRNLRSAAIAASKLSEHAALLGVDAAEIAGWKACADAVVVPFNELLGVHEQSRGFTDHAVWDFVGTPASKYPLFLHYPYYDLYRKQVVKQADIVLAMLTRGDAFTLEQKAANFAYYEQLTVRDSSLSACTQAVIAAEVGCLDLAYDYACEAAFMDLHDLEHNTQDGLHMASLAGAWIALLAGFGGMRDHDGLLTFAPRLPGGLTGLAFTITHRGMRLRVSADDKEATYTLMAHDATLVVTHHGQSVTLHPDVPITLPIPDLLLAPPSVSQPRGRAPLRRVRTRS